MTEDWDKGLCLTSAISRIESTCENTVNGILLLEKPPLKGVDGLGF